MDGHMTDQKITEGTPVTEIMHSDRKAYYVLLALEDPKAPGTMKALLLIRPKVRCLDFYAGDWTIEPFEDAKSAYAKDPSSRETRMVHRTRDGSFTVSGSVQDVPFQIGLASEYQDPSF